MGLFLFSHILAEPSAHNLGAAAGQYLMTTIFFTKTGWDMCDCGQTVGEGTSAGRCPEGTRCATGTRGWSRIRAVGGPQEPCRNHAGLNPQDGEQPALPERRGPSGRLLLPRHVGSSLCRPSSGGQALDQLARPTRMGGSGTSLVRFCTC